ncbi:MAG: DUF3105 domain-containing protein [Dehalococcoidia bacterium]
MKRHLMVCMYGLLCLSMIAVLVGCTPASPPSAPVTPVQPTPIPPVTPSQAALEDLKLPAHGDTTLLTNVISPPDEGRDHIWPDHPVEYKTMPPTSGPHFPDPTAPGFYTTRPAFGYLVHSLEHGSVVVYYDPSQLTPEIERSLKAFIKANSDPEVGIVAVPDADFKYPFILTAWDKMLQLNKYDPQVVRAFLAEFLGRGPESPSR